MKMEAHICGEALSKAVDDPVDFVLEVAGGDLYVVVCFVDVEAHSHVHCRVLVVVAVPAVYRTLSVEARLELILLELRVLLVSSLVVVRGFDLLVDVLTPRL